MAEAVVIFAVERLGDLLISEAKLLHGVSGEIDKIQRELKRMQGFLREADKKQIGDDRVRVWVAEMRELAFKTEDIIETFAMDVATKKQKSGLKEMLRRFVCIVSEGASLHKTGTEIRTIQGELSGLAASLPTYGITKGLEEGETSGSINLKNRRIFYSHSIEKDFVGMEKEIEQIISHLKKEDKRCEVVSICGMGGQGKTTVATQVYNHAQVKAHFEAFGWICVTQQFDREKVLKSILQQLLPAEREKEVLTMRDEVMVYELHKVQQEKNCLVVIDDIWTIDAWKNLCSAFPIGVTKSSSKILATTRNEMVAEIGYVYKLPGLKEDDGWQLLLKKAFPLTGDSPVKGVAHKMESIGRKMVIRCKGLPLAISTLGGMLRGKTLREWEIINRDISFYLARGKAGISDIDEYHSVTQVLGLRYDSLPPRLKQCFLCLANYNEDEVIEVEQLYLFWIAEGLISSEDKAHGEMMLNVAERYLDELAHRSLVQVVPRANEGVSWSKFEKCRVHDLIRDLCLSKVKEEKVIRLIDFQHKLDHDLESRNNRIRRLCIHPYDHMDESSVDGSVIQQIRSLLLFKDYNYEWNNWENICSPDKFKFLRVLTVQGFKLTAESLRSIGKLVYLKYLSFSDCKLEELPSAIGSLRNLETLDLRVRDAGDVRIPDIIWKFKNLKHLYLPHPYSRESVDNQVKLRLNGLNKLELIEGFDSKHCETRDLIGLSKIKVFEGRIVVDEDNLMIENTINFIKSKELCYSSLCIDRKGGGGGVSLVLLLECSYIDYLSVNVCITDLPGEYGNNGFSERLTILKLWECEIEEFDPMILLEKLTNLRYLYLGKNSYLGREMVCSPTGFRQLQTLVFSFLWNITSWRVDEGAMPNLSTLKIVGCDKMEMLPDGLRFLTSLKHLTIKWMPTAFSDRVGIIDGVEGQDFYKVRHVCSLFIV